MVGSEGRVVSLVVGAVFVVQAHRIHVPAGDWAVEQVANVRPSPNPLSARNVW